LADNFRPFSYNLEFPVAAMLFNCGSKLAYHGEHFDKLSASIVCTELVDFLRGMDEKFILSDGEPVEPESREVLPVLSLSKGPRS
jgi:hypothetical protein